MTVESITNSRKIIKNPKCERCGFIANPEKFESSPSAYYDLKCPKCGSIDIDWDYGGYKHNNLDVNKLEEYIKTCGDN